MNASGELLYVLHCGRVFPWDVVLGGHFSPLIFVSLEMGHKTKISLPPLLGKKKKLSVLFKMRYISSVFQLFWTFPLATLQRRELSFINIIH